MSDKPWDGLCPADQVIRKNLGSQHLGMAANGTYLRIEYIYGFEYFNTRPYHNYETWSDGYRVIDEANDIKVEREDLDQALKEWAQKLTAKRDAAASS